ncbi:MAG: ATP-binding cassette domain-containing protein [Alphaproteobacteria bacterium]|nr:ATP-binding cassette domain-containing protein [Alphaproteobacteria bacterium]
MSALLEVADLAFVSAKARELDSISFTLERGQSLCLEGGSGSGKSLLLRLLCGLERPSEGRILYDGVDVRGYGEGAWRKLRRQMGVALDGAGLISHLTLSENIAYPLLARGEGDEALSAALEFSLAYFDLYPWRAAMPPELPSGLVRRALLARATITNPPLLLCDTPFEGLHDEARDDIARALSRYVTARGLSLIYTARSDAEAALVPSAIVRLP